MGLLSTGGDMSRWNEQYRNHPFQAVWSNLKTNLGVAKVDDVTVSTSVAEMARLPVPKFCVV